MAAEMTQVDKDPTPDRRTYYRNVATGDRGYMVRRHGADHIRFDRPGSDQTRLFKAEEWTLEQQSRRLPAHEIAQVAFVADRQVCKLLGKLAESRLQWLDLDNDERVRWVKEGPRVPADSMRSRVWRSIVNAMVLDG